MNFENLLSISDSLDIITLFEPLKHKKAFSVHFDNESAIVIDTSKIENNRELKRIYSEELGHCVTKGFYPIHYCTEPLRRSNIEKAEHKAQEASYIFQVPFSELQEAIKKGSDDYEIAELLDVDIETLHEVFEYYQCKELL